MTDSFRFDHPVRVVVSGATGQDAHFLIPMLLKAGAEVHTLVRDRASARTVFGSDVSKLVIHQFTDLASHDYDVVPLLASLRPDYFFNLAGQSSVRESIARPALSWAMNADWPARLLEALHIHSPETRLYQASSSEMFGAVSGEANLHDEASPLHPYSPYAASKAAAHVMCGAYRESYGLRIACGILFNHESKYRSGSFLTAKIAAHVSALRVSGSPTKNAMPLRIGNLDVQRDWGYAGDFAEGILLIASQISVRSKRSGIMEKDEAKNYHDYVLGTGTLTSVRELVDRAFAIGGFELNWDLHGGGHGRAFFRGTDRVAVETSLEFFRPAEPMAIQANARRSLDELGWRATASIDEFLSEMLGVDGLHLHGSEGTR